MNFSNTLNLPKTKFSMRANLPLREPSFLKFWYDNKIYEIGLKNKDKNKVFILHDGPPYSNGRIHLGQALNKILKDIIVKFKTLQGYYAPYVPGWDTHGLPNELQTIKTYKIDRRKVSPLHLREKCKEYSLHFMQIQKEQFKRLGVMADWDKPYLTLDKTYEASIVKVFKEMFKEGYVYRGLKPVYWCPHCETSLADAEIEYNDKESYSIYVKFPLLSDISYLFDNKKLKVYVVIWTTTPWTLPANVAIALHPDYIYSFIQVNNEIYLIAKDLLQSFVDETGIKDYKILYEVDGKKLENLKAKHPFLDRESILILQDYVTLEQGTGCVHTAPGHGMEDFKAGKQYNLPVLVPVDSVGKMKKEAGEFVENLFYKEANIKIIEKLKELGLLLYNSTIEHSYPHCWRCHNPVIFRATKQWFVNIDHKNLRREAIKELDKIQWFPEWGHERMEKMLLSRPDWCLSRQRVWGIPIPVIYCKNCLNVVVDADKIELIQKKFEKEGSDIWYSLDPQDILGNDFSCPHCGGRDFEKEMDIFDVWFESGVSHTAVLESRDELSWPSDIYLEGNDQYRGWFQVSLLTSMATKKKAPYRQVITHGWVLDDKGRTMHKSLGNVVDPMDVIKKYGADILRLFLASIEFKNDIKVGDSLLKQTGDNYRKIRNTMRFLLGNLYDFDKSKHFLKYQDLLEIDKWALSRMQNLIKQITFHYNNYDFHKVYKELVNFASVDMSAFYLDILKDRLYTYAKDSIERRSAQSVLYYIVYNLVILMYPILSFTAEDVWQYIPNKEHISVHLANWPKYEDKFRDLQLEKKWENIIELRDKIYNYLEQAKLKGLIKQPLESKLILYVKKDLKDKYITISKQDLKTVFIVSQLDILEFEDDIINKDLDLLQLDKGLYLKIERAKGKKCARCWNYFEQMSSENPQLCQRCADIVKDLQFSVS